MSLEQRLDKRVRQSVFGVKKALSAKALVARLVMELVEVGYLPGWDELRRAASDAESDAEVLEWLLSAAEEDVLLFGTKAYLLSRIQDAFEIEEAADDLAPFGIDVDALREEERAKEATAAATATKKKRGPK